MADLILADEGLAEVETAIFASAYPPGTTLLRLFTDNLTFDRTLTSGSLHEPSVAGYAAQSLGLPVFANYDSATHRAYGFSNVCVFTTSDAVGETVYGAFVLNSSTGHLLCGYNFPSPQTFSASSPIVAQIKHTYGTEFTS